MLTPNRRFDDKILAKKNAWLWAWIDIPGGVWLTLYSGSMLAMWWITFRHNLHVPADQRIEIPAAITATYSVVVGAFAASNIARWYRSSKCGHSDPEPSSTSASE